MIREWHLIELVEKHLRVPVSDTNRDTKSITGRPSVALWAL
jgi:hypothetical protein